METCLVPPLIKKINLPNKKHDQKIDLNKLFTNLKTNESFQASYDKRKNPYQNWVEIIITGKVEYSQMEQQLLTCYYRMKRL